MNIDLKTIKFLKNISQEQLDSDIDSQRLYKSIQDDIEKIFLYQQALYEQKSSD